MEESVIPKKSIEGDFKSITSPDMDFEENLKRQNMMTMIELYGFEKLIALCCEEYLREIRGLK